MELYNLKGKQNTISDALRYDPEDHAVISVTGSGGKTSLIFAWARELADSGKRVAVTTTTHMHSPKRMAQEPVDLYAGIPVILSKAKDLIASIDSALSTRGIVFVFSPDEKDPAKVTAPPEEILQYLYDTADVTLVEADGSRRMPLKWPGNNEPVVPERTDLTVCVAGLSAVGKKPEDVIFRYDEMPERFKCETVDVNLMHKIISSREGGKKGVRGDFRVFLNQLDGDIDRLAASYRLQQIFSVLGTQTAWGSLLGQTEANEAGSKDLKIAVILLASGNSTRFGSNKLLYIMDDGRPMAAYIMDTVCSAIDTSGTPLNNKEKLRFSKILVTQYEEVAGLAPDFETVINDRPDLGISRSMQLGIEAAGDADAYMFCVCDQPGIRPATLQKLWDTYSEADKKGAAPIVSLALKGKMCSPKIFSSKYRDELMSLSGDTGGRQIIADHRDELILVEASDESETIDIDQA